MYNTCTSVCGLLPSFDLQIAILAKVFLIPNLTVTISRPGVTTVSSST